MKYVLFVCDHNAGRSQMAIRSPVMAIAHRKARECLRAERCGALA